MKQPSRFGTWTVLAGLGGVSAGGCFAADAPTPYTDLFDASTDPRKTDDSAEADDDLDETSGQDDDAQTPELDSTAGAGGTGNGPEVDSGVDFSGGEGGTAGDLADDDASLGGAADAADDDTSGDADDDSSDDGADDDSSDDAADDDGVTSDDDLRGDRDAFFGESRCAEDFVFCEDFEAESLDTSVWGVRGPAPELSTTHAARGSRSAHFQTEDNGLQYITQRDVFPQLSDGFYARIFLYVEALPTAPMWAHWSISAATGSGTESEFRVGGQYDGTINRFGVGSDHGPTGDWTRLDDDPGGEPSPVPAGEWTCLEWHNDAVAAEARFYWDDTEHESLFVSESDHGGTDDPFTFPQFEEVWFGWWHYQGGTDPVEFNVYIDEIVIDDERIGCTR